MTQEGKKIRAFAVVLNSISSISGSAKYSIKLSNYAADFANTLRFGLSALAFQNFLTAVHLQSLMQVCVFSGILF